VKQSSEFCNLGKKAMIEFNKEILRFVPDRRFAMRYFVGNGVEIGAGSDPLSRYAEQFPGMKTWSPRSLNVLDMQGKFSAQLRVLKVELLYAGFHHRAQQFDQTLTFTAECGIELVVRKWRPQKQVQKGRLPSPATVAAPQMSLEKKP
jgi:hypothetical protein